MGSVFLYVWRGKRGLTSSSYPSPTFFCLCFGPIFFKTCLFLWLVSAELFLNKAGRLAEKACGDGEAALCCLNGAIVRRGGGEGESFMRTEGVRGVCVLGGGGAGATQRLPQGVEGGYGGGGTEDAAVKHTVIQIGRAHV